MKKILGILIVVLLSICLLKPKEKVKLDNVILKQEVNNKTFAMYKEESENNYVPVEGTEFPKGYVLNIKESKCIDNNGNELENVLSYENDKVVLTTNKSSYCYLYFDKSLGLDIKEKEPKGLSIDKERGAMYRFQGQAKDAEGNELVDNYICFGTSDKELCKKDTDHYMYRIIGIEASTGRVKVIKKETLKVPKKDESKETVITTYQWWDNYDEDITFPNSKIYEAINGSDFLENTDFVPAGWEEKILDNTWTYGDMRSVDTMGAQQNGEGLYLAETGQKGTVWDSKANEGDFGALPYVVSYEASKYYGQTVYYTNGSGNWTDTFTGKVSLMYLHDYYLSVSDKANCQYDAGQYAICKTGWMHLSNNDTSVTGSGVHEWTMSRLGWSPWAGWFCGFDVYGSGCALSPGLVEGYSVRPVFYISASEELLSKDATGTITDPFIIKS